jgi:single-strand DNA-binding protein
MNKIIISGYLGKTPELISSAETSRTNFSVAVRRRGKKDVTDWFQCTAFGKTAEFVTSYATKGREVIVEGRMESYKAGDDNTRWSVTAENVELVGPRDQPQKQAGASEENEFDPFAD